MTLGKTIQKRRKALSLTQQELADKARVTKPYVSMVEAGKRTPSLEVLGNLAKALGSTVSEITEVL
jgi:transcriptional regulator with XRE-family HTH domain